MKTDLVKISEVKENPSNPRTIKGDKFDKLVKSIKEFPKMLEIRPIVVNDDMIVLGGNMRLKACKKAGLKEIHVIKASELTEEQQREFIIKDNVGFGEWDWGLLANEWDSDLLDEWGLDVPNWSQGLDVNNMTDEDVDIEEEFDPIGASSGLFKVIFVFDGKEEADSYCNKIGAKPEKKGQAWQVNLHTQFI